MDSPYLDKDRWWYNYEGTIYGPFPSREDAEDSRQDLLLRTWEAMSCRTGGCED